MIYLPIKMVKFLIIIFCKLFLYYFNIININWIMVIIIILFLITNLLLRRICMLHVLIMVLILITNLLFRRYSMLYILIMIVIILSYILTLITQICYSNHRVYVDDYCSIVLYFDNYNLNFYEKIYTIYKDLNESLNGYFL